MPSVHPSDHTLAPEERFTAEKAAAFLERYRPELERLGAEVAAAMAGPSASPRPTVTLYAPKELVKRYPVRAKGNGIIRAGEVTHAKGGAGTPTTVGLFVEWATGRVFKMYQEMSGAEIVRGERVDVRPQAGAPPVTVGRPSAWSAPSREYRSKNLGWSGRAALRRDPTKAPPHPDSPEVVDAEVRRRVEEDLAPLFAEGWEYFGSYARAVALFTRPERARWGWSDRVLVEGCAVKLQRTNGAG